MRDNRDILDKLRWLSNDMEYMGVPLPVTTDTAKWDFQPVPRGCICPPTSEQTCMNPECGRKPRAALGGE